MFYLSYYFLRPGDVELAVKPSSTPSMGGVLQARLRVQGEKNEIHDML
jgi:hypothetical protein